MKFFLITAFFTFLLFAISTDSTANAKTEMQGINSVLQIESFDSDGIITAPTRELKKKPINPVKVAVVNNDAGTKGFMLSLSPLLIDFDEISPTNPISRTSLINIRNTSMSVYSLFMLKNHQLANNESVFIPDTSCDNGACTSQTTAVWQNTLSFGFGYRCDNVAGNDCAGNFFPEGFFRQIPDENSDKPADILHGSKSNSAKTVQITFKVNTSASQPLGSYSNLITVMAVPGY